MVFNIITQSTAHCIAVFRVPQHKSYWLLHTNTFGLSLQLPPPSRAPVRPQRCQWCWVSPQFCPVMLRAHPHPVSPGWRTTSPSCPVPSWHTPAVGRLCGWAQHEETALASTPVGPLIQLALLSNTILSVFWVRHTHTLTSWNGLNQTFNDISVFLKSVPPQIEGDSTSLTFGGQEEKVRVNGSLTLSCLAKGFPEPKVAWFKDGQVGVSSLWALHLLKPHFFLKWLSWASSSLYQPLLATGMNYNILNRTCIRLHKPPPLSRFSAMSKPVNYSKWLKEACSEEM